MAVKLVELDCCLPYRFGSKQQDGVQQVVKLAERFIECLLILGAGFFRGEDRTRLLRGSVELRTDIKEPVVRRLTVSHVILAVLGPLLARLVDPPRDRSVRLEGSPPSKDDS